MRLLFLFTTLSLLLTRLPAVAQQAEVLDGVAAIVNKDVITISQVRELIGSRERSLREVPTEYMERHLKETSVGRFQIHADTSRLVDIQHLNLHDKVAMRKMRSYDFIFCRNVLIYFDDISLRTAVDHFYNALNPGGYIFLGHSESIGRISSSFQLLRVGQHLVYRKE